MRSINIRFLVFLVLGVGVAAVGVFFLHRYQVRRQADGELLLAQEAEGEAEEEDPDAWFEAYGHYRRYLSFNRDNVDACEAYGLLCMKLFPHGMQYGVRFQDEGVSILEEVVRQDGNRSKSRRALAELYLKYGQHKQAEDHLKALREANPKDAEVIVWQGLCHQAKERLDEAEKSYKLAIKTDPKWLDSYLAMAGLLQGQREREKEAEIWVDKMVENNPKSADAYCRRGQRRLMTGKIEDATKDAQKAIELEPDSLLALHLASSCAIAGKDFVKAKEHALRIVKLSPDKPIGYLLLGQIEMLSGKADEAVRWTDKGIAAVKDTAELRLRKAILLLARGKLDEVEPILTKLKEERRVDPDRLRHFEAMLNYYRGNWAKAIKLFEEARPGLSKLPDGKNLIAEGYERSSECYRRLGRTELATQAIQRAQEQGAAPAARQEVTPALAISVLLSRGETDRAIEACRRLLALEKPPVEAKLLLAQALLAKNAQIKDPAARNWTEVETAFDEASQAMPHSIAPVLGRTHVLLLQGHKEEASKRLRDAIEMQQQRRARWSVLIESVQREADSAAAAKLLDAPLADWGQDSRVLSGVKKVLEKGERDRAIEALARGRDRETDAWPAWEILYRLAAEDKQWDKAIGILDEAQQDCGDTVDVRIARAKIAYNQDRKTTPAAIKKIREHTEKYSKAECGRLWHSLGQLAVAADDLSLAIELQGKAADADPTNLERQEELFRLAVVAENDALVQKTLEEISKIDLNGPSWHYHSALRLYLRARKEKNEATQKSMWKEALNHVVEARSVRPQWVLLPRLAGLVHAKLGNDADAIANLRDALSQGSRDPECINVLAGLLKKAGRMDEWREVLGRLEQEQTALSASALVERAADSIRQGRLDQAESDYRKAVDELQERMKTSPGAMEHQAQGDIYRQLGKLALQRKDAAEAAEAFRQSEAALRRSLEIEPNNAKGWFLLVDTVRLKDPNASIDGILDEIRKKVSLKNKPLFLGQAYAQLQRVDEAEQQYLAALEASKGDPAVLREVANYYLRYRDPAMRAKAEPLLRTILADNRTASKEQVAWARLELASRLSESRSFEDRQEAFKLIEANLAENPGSENDLRAKAQLLARFAGSKERREALAIFGRLAEKADAAPEDCFNHARLLEADNQWDAATRQMRRALSSPVVQAKWLLFAVGAQIRHQELLGAQTDLEQLEKMLGPHDVVCVALRSRLLSERGLHDQAIRVLNDFAEKANDKMPDRQQRLWQAARHLEALAQDASGPERDKIAAPYLVEAEKKLNALAKENPEHQMRLVSFLGRRGRTEDALRLIEKAWAQGKPLAVASNVASLLVQGAPSDEQVHRMETILEDALQRHGQDVHLSLAVAELRAVQRRYDEAEKLYRDVLAKQSDNALALNNLAVFLALRGVKLDEAADFINRAIRISGPMDYLLDSRATVHLARGEWEEAVADMDVALQVNTTGPRLFHRALALAAGGRMDEAASAIEQADSLGLTVEDLQPLERPAYRELKKKLQGPDDSGTKK